jgi:hypothetical protein
VPFRVFDQDARPATFPPEAVLSWNWLLVQSLSLAVVSPLLVWRSHLAVRPFLRLRGFPATSLGWEFINNQPIVLSSSFAFLQSVTQPNLADPPQPVSSSLGLLFPTAHEEPKVHLPQASPARYVPPSGFGCPLGGLLPSIPCRFCFTPAALLGFTLRSLLPRKVSGTFPPGSTHLPFLLPVYPMP